MVCYDDNSFHSGTNIFVQLRSEHVRSTQLQQERLEKELRNKEAQALEAEIAKQKRREKESILDELVSNISRELTLIQSCDQRQCDT